MKVIVGTTAVFAIGATAYGVDLSDMIQKNMGSALGPNQHTVGGGPVHAGGDLYSNGAGPDYTNGNEMTQWAQAEDFTGVTGVIGSASFSALDINNNGLANWDGVVQYAIYEGDPNLGNVVGSGDGVNPTAAFDQNNGSWDFYDIDFELAAPVAVDGGTTYYLALHMGSDFVFDGIYFATQAANGTGSGVESNGGFGGPWNANGLEHYFTLTAVPAPGAVALLGIAGIGLTRRRR
jgi:MYXO-CTERM domain-containing protein